MAKQLEALLIDPWHHRTVTGTHFPQPAKLVCAYELHVNPFTLQEVLYLHRARESDELWSAAGLDLGLNGVSDGAGIQLKSIERLASSFGCALATERDGDDASAALALFEGLIRAKREFAWPTGFLVAGLIGEPSFTTVLTRIEGELNRNAAEARRNHVTEIVKTAEALGLAPRPEGRSPKFWLATCPRTNHNLYINADVNEFGCGWCKRKGGPEELRRFVAERKLGLCWRRA